MFLLLKFRFESLVPYFVSTVIGCLLLIRLILQFIFAK